MEIDQVIVEPVTLPPPAGMTAVATSVAVPVPTEPKFVAAPTVVPTVVERTVAVELTAPLRFWLPSYIYTQDPWGELQAALEWQQYELS